MRSFLKALSILILGLFLTLGIKALPVHAAENWEAPEWTDYKTAEFRWKIPDDIGDYYEISLKIYKDGEEYTGVGLVPSVIYPGRENNMLDSWVVDGYYYAKYALAFDASGSYTLRADAVILDENRTYIDVKSSPMSEAYDYTLPSTALPAPTNPVWVDHTGEPRYGDYGVFAYSTCDVVPGAAVYYFDYFLSSKPDNTLFYYNVWSPKYGWSDKPNEWNLSYYITDLTNCDYTFRVRAIPMDITQYAPSEFSVMSDKYGVSDTVTAGSLALKSDAAEVNPSNVDGIVEDIKALENLDTVLRASSESLRNLDIVEEVYKSANNITENAPVSTVDGISSSEIEVTGASLNVAPGTTLGLNIGTPEPYPTIDANLYNQTLVFDMGIQATDGTDFSRNLDIPVTIKLPVPARFLYSNLKILHFRADGTIEEVPFRYDGGYIYITVYHFSTFAFVDGGTSTEPIPKRMHRMYNPNSGEHFYTGSDIERDNLVNAGWNYEGPGWDAPENLGAPVYRFYNETLGDHHYTMDESEVEYLNNSGWNYEGVAWNSAPEDTGKPLYRLYNPNAYANGESGAHHYTLSETERDNLAAAGWKYEGVAWYSL